MGQKCSWFICPNNWISLYFEKDLKTVPLFLASRPHPNNTGIHQRLLHQPPLAGNSTQEKRET